MENENTQLLKNRAFARIFEGIDDELAILTATAKFNHTTCKADQHVLKLTLAYIDDTKQIVSVLKKRINLLMETTKFENTSSLSP